MNTKDERWLLDEARAAIAALPGVAVEPGERKIEAVRPEPDMILAARVKEQPVLFVIVAKAHGYPRDVREALHRFAQVHEAGHSPPIVPVFVAPAISDQSRELLRSAGTGYWDAGGSLYLDLPTALFWIDRPVPKAAERRLRSIFRGRAAQVVHALLLEPGREWRVRELAALAEAAPSTVHQVFEHLERQLWVEKVGTGPRAIRRLREPGALLDAWAEAHTLGSYGQRRFHRWTQRPDALRDLVVSALERWAPGYALTLASGAQLVAPFVTEHGRLTVLVPADLNLDVIVGAVGLSLVDEGENVVFCVPRQRAPLLFRQRVANTWVASDVQLYLDLWAWPQRGKDQARHLRRERLGY